MPTYKITAPDGKVFNVTGDGTAEEALAQFQAQYGQQVAPRQTQPGTPPQNPNPSAVAEPGFADYAKDLGKGLLYSGQRASAGITGLLPRAVEEFLVKKGLSPSQEQLDAGKAAVAGGTAAADVGQIAGDVATQFLPSKKITQAAQGLTTLPRILANLAGQGGLNAALTPDSENRAIGAATGAGAAAIGGIAGRLVGGPLRNMVTKEGQTLLDAGLTPTPGQALSGTTQGILGRGIANTERALAHFPIVGDVVRGRAGRAGTELVEQEVNKALTPIGRTATGAGSDLLDSARSKISEVYDDILPEISIPIKSLPTLVDDAITQVRQTNPLFDEGQEKLLRRWESRRINNLVDQGVDVAGSTAQQLDRELGELIRKYTGKKNPTVYESDLGAGFKQIQESLRAAMVGTTPESTSILANARQARAKLQNVIQAADPVSGLVSPKALAATAAKRKELTPLQQAASNALPELPQGGSTAGGLLLHNLLSPAALGAGAAGANSSGHDNLASLLTAAAGVSAMYTKPGMRYLTQGAHPLIEALRKKVGAGQLPRDEVELMIQQLIAQPTRATINMRTGE